MKDFATIFLVSGLIAGVLFITNPQEEYLLAMAVYGGVGMLSFFIYETFFKTNNGS